MTGTASIDLPRDLVLFGIGDFAERVRYYFETFTPHRVVGFTVEHAYLDRSEFAALPVAPFEALEESFAPEKHSLFVCAGYRDQNRTRERICTLAEARGYGLASCVASSAAVHGSVGPNSLIMDLAAVGPFVELGRGQIIGAGVVLTHHLTVGDFCFFAANVTVAGHCRIGRRAFLGAGAAIADKVTIPDETFIGIGSVVTKSIRRSGVYAGNPARFLRERF